MPIPLAVGLGITGISALAGLLGNRKKTTTQTQDSTTTQSGTQSMDSYETPMLSGDAMTGYSQGINALLNRLRSSTDLAGFKASGVRDIGRQQQIQQRMLERNLAARGLNNSPAAAAIEARSADASSGRMLDFLGSLPLLQRQLESEDAGNLIRAASSIPVGRHSQSTATSSGTSRTQGTATNTDPGNMLGGLFSGLGQGIASTFGYNAALSDAMKRYGLASPGSNDLAEYGATGGRR